MTAPNVFTVNGDGINEKFVIGGIKGYPEAKMYIFNRWGNTVYSATNYDNSWDGISNGGAVIEKGEKLPSGSYYYILDLGNGEPAKKGWIYIVTK